MTGNYNSLTIDGYVVEISQSKNYVRIIGDLYKKSSEFSHTYASNHCFQIFFKEGSFLDMSSDNDLIIRHKAQVTSLKFDDDQLEEIGSYFQEEVICVEQDQYDELVIQTDKVGLTEILDYLSEDYQMPEWSGVENTATIQGVIVDKSLPNKKFRIMTEVTTPDQKTTYQCFEVSMSEEVYDRFGSEIDEIHLGDTLIVKGSIFYLDASFHHMPYTYDNEPKTRKKFILNVHAKSVMHLPPLEDTTILKYIDEYLQDRYRLAQYGDDNQERYTTASLTTGYY